MGDKMNPLSIVYSCYNSQEMIIFSLNHYRTYKDKYLDNLEFLIVDDGSNPPLLIDGTGLNLKHLRIKEEIPWNQGGAKNLGTIQASNDWILYLDADRIIPTETLDFLFNNIEKGHYYLFAQINFDGSSRGTKKPFGVFCAEKSEMLKVKGFDERFCGTYGYEDLQLSKKLKVGKVQKVKLNDKYLIAYDTIMDGKVKNLSRDLKRNKELFTKSRRERYAFKYSLWLNFDWELSNIWTR